MKLNLACGARPREGYINLDLQPHEGCGQADCLKLDYPDESIEEILSEHFVEHLTRPELEAFFAQAQRLLCPGGLLVLRAPCMACVIRAAASEAISFQEADHYLFALQRHAHDFHRQGIWEEKLEAFCERYGFAPPEFEHGPEYEITMTASKGRESLMDDATRAMERNWEVYHEQQKTTALTGSTISHYCTYHGLSEDQFRPGLRVLEVGVGLGHAVRQMAERGCEVYALDICPRALKTVAPFVKAAFLHRDVASLPSDFFDLVTHHLVSQHMSDRDLRWQLPHVIRSMKVTGRLHIQWAGSDVPGENDLRESIVGKEGHPDKQNTPSMMGGRMCRSEAYATEIIEDSGGRVMGITDRRQWPQFASSWFSMMVERRQASATLVIACRNRAEQLRTSLAALRERAYQGIRILALDDGSTDGTAHVLEEHLDILSAFRVMRRGGYRRNPSDLLNVGHDLANTDIVLEQGAEVVHLNDCVTPLVGMCRPGVVALARVYNGSPNELKAIRAALDAGTLSLPDDYEPETVSTIGDRWVVPRVGTEAVELYCGKERAAPFLFLGAIHRSDFEAVGKYDATLPGRNDEDLANRLLAHGVRFRFLGRAVAFHLHHGKT